jgi:hypothetical protein
MREDDQDRNAADGIELGNFLAHGRCRRAPRDTR